MGKISKLVALTLLMSFALSQTTGKIRGTVTSADGQPLAGANVIVDGTTKGAATDGEGNYTILNVEAGSYSVTASYIGYQSSTESNVSVKVDLTTPLSFAMQTSAERVFFAIGLVFAGSTIYLVVVYMLRAFPKNSEKALN